MSSFFYGTNKPSFSQPKKSYAEGDKKKLFRTNLFRFFLYHPDKNGGKRDAKNIVFLDDRAACNDQQNRILDSIGLAQGPFVTLEHNMKINGRWGNIFTCADKIRMNPFLRMLYFKDVGAWYKLGPEVDEADNPLEFYANDILNEATFRAIIDADHYHKVEDIVNTPLGQSMWKGGCPVCNSGDKPGQRTFRTVLDRSKSVSKKDGTVYENQLRLFVTTKRQSAQWETEENGTALGKKRTSLSRYGYKVERSNEDKSPSTGDVKSLQEDLSVDEILQLNPDAYISLTQETVRARLEDDHRFYFHLMNAAGLSFRDVDSAVAHIADNFDLNNGVLIPNVGDYYLSNLPKTPNYLAEIFSPDDDFNEDDVPF